MQEMSQEIYNSQESFKFGISSMQEMSQEMYNSQESFKSGISSSLANNNSNINLKFAELEKYIKLLDAKLEKCQQPPITGDLPSGQGHVQNSFTMVQKPQDKPGLTTYQTYSLSQQSNKGNMESTISNSFSDDPVNINQNPSSADHATTQVKNDVKERKNLPSTNNATTEVKDDIKEEKKNLPSATTEAKSDIKEEQKNLPTANNANTEVNDITK